uniref:Rho family GTPase 2 n=1 Tax=Callorhinchus milii TaxID=7868 RepID=A0A4W3HND6_CALMI
TTAIGCRVPRELWCYRPGPGLTSGDDYCPQGSTLARQIGAVAYVECSSKVSENSVRDVFHMTTLATVNKTPKNLKRSNSKRGLKRVSQGPGRTDLLEESEIRKDRAKSCSIM